MHLFRELKGLDEQTVTDQFLATAKYGYRFGANALEVTATQLPAFSEMAKVIVKKAMHDTGDASAANSAGVGCITTASMVLENLYTQSLDSHLTRSRRAAAAIRNLQTLDSTRVVRVLVEYYRDLANDPNSPDLDNTMVEYPGLYTLPDLVKTEWQVENGDEEEAEYVHASSIMTVATIRELEKDFELEAILGPRDIVC